MAVRLDSTTLSAAAAINAAESDGFALSINSPPGCTRKNAKASNGPRTSESPPSLFNDRVLTVATSVLPSQPFPGSRVVGTPEWLH